MSGRDRACVARRWVLALAASAACWTQAAAAQTRFEWPDTTVNLASYTSVEQCLVMTRRVRGGVRQHEARDPTIPARDTTRWNPRWKFEPLPAPVVAAADRCASRLGAPTAVPLADYVPFMRLYLAADRDRDAAALLARRLAAVPKSQSADRAAITDSALHVYLDAQPVRLAAAESLLLERASSKTDRIQRLRVYTDLMNACDAADDSVRARRAAQRVVTLLDSLTKTERESEEFEKLLGDGGLPLLVATHILLGDKIEMDSLRRSTEAYGSLLRHMWATVMKMRLESFPDPVGEQAAEIEASYWFHRPDTTASYPRRGHITLVDFLDRRWCMGNRIASRDDIVEGSVCYPEAAALRRLAAKYPALDIVLIAPTHGFFMYGPPVSPAEEAELIRKWTEAHGLNFTLAVAETPILRLDAPDGRRVERPEPNATHYMFGKSLISFGTLGAMLLDQDGQYVRHTGAWGAGELEYERFIDALLERAKGDFSDER